MLDTHISDLERLIESVIAKEKTSAAKARLMRSIPGIGPVSAAMLIAEMPELGRMTSGEAAAMNALHLSHTTVELCEAGEQLQEDGAPCDMFCSRPHLPPLVTIRF